MKTKRPTLIPVIQALVAAILFGVSAPILKLLLSDFHPIPLAGFLYLGSGLGGWLAFSIQRVHRRGSLVETHITRGDLPWLAGALLAGGVAAPMLLLVGLKSTPAATASLLLNFESAATTVIAVLVFKEAVDRRIWWAVALVTSASILLTWTGGVWGFSPGALGVLGACLLWGLDNNLTRQISGRNPLLIVGIKGLCAGLFSLLLAALLGIPLPDIRAMVSAMLVGSICYGLSIQLFILALRSLGAARTGILFGSAPFVGGLVSLVFLHEIPGALFWASLPVMLLGAWLMLSESHLHPHTHETHEHSHAHDHTDDHHIHTHAGEVESLTTHAHDHLHVEVNHDHPHTPDLHHRHSH